MNIDRAIDEYLSYLRIERGSSPLTVEAYSADLADYASFLDEVGIADVQRIRQGTFNRRFVCRLVGTLLAMNVYCQEVPQTEYTRLLEGSNRSNLRKEVNQGVDDESTRLYLRQLLKSLNG